ncbi:MAG TPA: VOC family protein [Dehalococcoidia bacterium]|nr:VOC family protein [Dehalococcoidia bacterium]
MSAPPGIVPFHVGIAVHDIDEVIERYKRLFGIEHWHVLDGADAKRAYGGYEGRGQAFELMQPHTTDSEIGRFLEAHGEGVQHIGFWAPDLRAALQQAVDGGAKILPGAFETQNGVVIEAEAPPGAARPFRLAFVDSGAGSMRWEIIGAPSDVGLRNWLRDDYDVIIKPPPW